MSDLAAQLYETHSDKPWSAAPAKEKAAWEAAASILEGQFEPIVKPLRAEIARLRCAVAVLQKEVARLRGSGPGPTRPEPL